MITVIIIIIGMTKLLDADWLRSVQLFHLLYSSTINDFAKTNKMVESKMAKSHSTTKKIKYTYICILSGHTPKRKNLGS